MLFLESGFAASTGVGALWVGGCARPTLYCVRRFTDLNSGWPVDELGVY